ncbi:ribosome small subunit-dependent GTPase A [Humidesulfovibrio idahonensis]
MGFDQWFEAGMCDAIPEGCGLARVCAVNRGSCLVREGSREVPAELSGRLCFQLDSPAALPCVGDWVAVQLYNDGAAAIIHQVLPRRTFLRRKAAGPGQEHQMIAANVDTAFLVQSCRYDFNPARLERYLVMVAEGRVEPVVVLTKTDLIGAEELEQKLAAVRARTGAVVVALSSVTGEGFAALHELLCAGRTYCLLGSSGVGKTTLLNRLLGREAFETKGVSGTGEGTHTTTRRQLVLLGQGAILIDSPGMRELGLMDAGEEGLAGAFDDVSALAANCRYADCLHRGEPGCAVRAAIEGGELAEERLASYFKLRKESEFNAMTALEKRRKDKAFGRFVKEVKKRMRD